ncbi:AraC family transcriptional regulator [Pollutibacter soli]|uniref:helix-turn-helix domain-containing protein n=1 Tax=Pollutibacter soli TaxID=3034157 RepID=UPI0030133A54
MSESTDIISQALNQPVMVDEFVLLSKKEKQIPGTWQYQIRRYQKLSHWVVEDTGELTYNYNTGSQNGRYLELRFCIAGMSWCYENDASCEACRKGTDKRCEMRLPVLDVVSFRFEPEHLAHLVKGQRKKTPTLELLNFRNTQSFTRSIPIGNKIRQTLETFLGHNYTDTFENIYVNAQTQILLLYALEGILDDEPQEEEVPACKFLANHHDRDKIMLAREILLEHIGDPITIKELSRKVGINECYLKKGFKVMFGSTIFDFYQDQRMEHARFLLYEKGKNVSEVSALLGYSSISHFSTAFKKHTGLKPCELLIR